ncbi:MAG: hypothetical protein AAGG68_20085 [Bacteroidota bacterium]
MYNGSRRKGRGCPKQFDGQIDPRNLRADYFKVFDQATDSSWIAYHAVVKERAWKRSASVVIIHDFDENGQIKSYRIFACTETEMSGSQVKYNYEARYQIEFLFRDAKQEAGLGHCQARSEQKLHFHVNTALTCVSLDKAVHYLSNSEQLKEPFRFKMRNYLAPFKDSRRITLKD